MKRFSIFILIFAILFTFSFSSLADIDDMKGTVSAPGYVLIDAEDPETLLYAGGPDKQVAPASTTKILTCIIALEKCPDLDEVITINPNATRFGSTNSLMGLKKEENISIRDLLYGLMLVSGNDAATALAYHISGSVEDFAVLMNEKAAELGMINSNFVTPSGVFKGQHYSTAHDMARVSAYAMKNPMFRKIVSTVQYTVPANDVRKKELELINTNKMISDPETSKLFYDKAIGIKTGSTVQGGKCLVTAAEKDGVTLIAVTLGLADGGSKSQRMNKCYTDSIAMFESAFNNLYSYVSFEDLNQDILGTATIPILNCSDDDEDNGILAVTASFDKQQAYLSNDTIQKIQSGEITLEQKITPKSDYIEAPVYKGDTLGSIQLLLNERVLFEGDLKASRDVKVYTEPAPTAAPAISATTDSSVTDVSVQSKAAVPQFSNILFIAIMCGMVLAIVVLIVVLLGKRGK